MVTKKQKIGEIGEEIAVKYLKKHGYKIKEQNWRSNRWGEIDIIATQADYLVFVEVKTRTTQEFGAPHCAVTYNKLKNLKKAAKYYICTYKKIPQAYRIDVVGIYLPNNKSQPVIKLYKNVQLQT